MLNILIRKYNIKQNMSKDLESAIIKTPYKKMSYSEHHIQELAKCADPVTGPRYFMSNYFYIQHPTRGSMAYHPWDYQKRLGLLMRPNLI